MNVKGTERAKYFQAGVLSVFYDIDLDVARAVKTGMPVEVPDAAADKLIADGVAVVVEGA